ncbi:pili assembly chaperone [Pseudoxanthomonas broegbernensis]|uniref:Pili assembly chaperone n=1 Tax=Pseudoxanthomonas broegbernensis TaxID=83619 RepID=A0A7V8K6U7_9GAMM|nr:fimbria/pilus periplasmic chaperone [Pseudoxanthomonas broegbernensis]KAF1686301.1 pili assembly chaperone [Pseudoxanthomonas broegbernensis]MBB6063987.1 fimbrial chaperone protein [Pseudoxanthomonas broegbernensis]
MAGPFPGPAVPVRRRALLLAACLALSGAGVGARAADLQVSPILLEFAQAQQAQAIWLSNSGQHPLRAQVRVHAWSQDGGEDRLAPTRDLVASPATLEIAPGAQQMVRVVRLQPGPAPTERSYRLLVDELPPAAAQARPAGLQFLLRYSIPVFLEPAGPAPAVPAAQASLPGTGPASLRFALEPAPGGSRLVASNAGTRRAKLSQLVLVAADGGARALNQGLLGYVLAGQTMSWPLPVSHPLAPDQTLEARFNDDPDARPLPLDGAGR